MALSYTHLYDLLRRERGHQELQELPALFYEEAHALLRELALQATSPSLIAAEQARTQLVNTKKLFKQIYEYREQKVMLLAQNHCKTGSSMLDTSRLLALEKVLYEELTRVLTEQRTSLNIDDLQSLAGARRAHDQHEADIAANAEGTATAQVLSQDAAPVSLTENEAETRAEQKPRAASAMAAPLITERITVRLVKAVPAFVGKGMETYGPFAENERVELPSPVAQVLIRKGNAEPDA